MKNLVANESGGCGGGSSSISLFSVLVSILGVLLFKNQENIITASYNPLFMIS